MNKIDEKLRLLQPVLGNQKINSLRSYYVVEDDYQQKMEIENHIDFLISKHVCPEIEKQIFLPPHPSILQPKDINIGTVEYNNKRYGSLYLGFNDINRHIGIFGSTGSGKTTFALHLIRQLHSKKMPFIIFDWEKSYRCLIDEYDDVQVFTVGNEVNPFFLNFLTVPPGINYDEYMKSLISIISEAYIGGIGSDTMLLQYMEMAYEQTRNPVFEDLKHIVIDQINKDMGSRGKLSGRAGLWKESVMRQIVFLSKGASGNVINTRKHHELAKLLDQTVVLEFGNLKSPYDKKFFIHVILNWLSIYLQHRGLTTDKLKNVIFFEEFHNIAMHSQDDNLISNLFREIRKYGVGLVAIDQTPSAIPNAIFANMNTKVAFTLITSKDIYAMAKAMNSSNFEYFGMLKTGNAIVNVKQRHHDSFLIKTPFIKQNRYITDIELHEAMKRFKNDLSVSMSSIQSIKLKPVEKIILMNVIERPFDGVDVRTKRLGMHPSQMVQIHESLSSKGLIKSVYINRKKLFELTDSGKTLAVKLGFCIRKTKGGLEHAYWIDQIVQFLKKNGCFPKCEIQAIDIVDFNNSIAIEVETGKSDIQSNLSKLERCKFSNCLMIATNKQALIKLNKFKNKNVKIFYVKNFLKLSKKNFKSHLIVQPNQMNSVTDYNHSERRS